MAKLEARIRQWFAAVPALVLAAVVATPLASGGETRTAETLQLTGVLSVDSRRDAACPPETGPGILCPARTGTGVVRGLGRVRESYTYLVAEEPASCPAGQSQALGYSIRWVIEGKGEIHFAVSPSVCDPTAYTVDQSYTVTAGTGLFAGVSGSGLVDRALFQTSSGARGSETWRGTLTVPGLEFDVTPPVMSGARSKTVRVPRTTTRARVSYRVTAADGAEGSVPARCTPASGARFKVGRTRVRCIASDSSGNSTTAGFTVIVKRR